MNNLQNEGSLLFPKGSLAMLSVMFLMLFAGVLILIMAVHEVLNLSIEQKAYGVIAIIFPVVISSLPMIMILKGYAQFLKVFSHIALVYFVVLLLMSVFINWNSWVPIGTILAGLVFCASLENSEWATVFGLCNNNEKSMG